MPAQTHITLRAKDTCLILSCAAGTPPALLYWGQVLDDTPANMLEIMATRQHAHGSADDDIPATLLNELGGGVSSAIGFSAHRGGQDWASVFSVEHITQPDAQSVTLTCFSPATHIRAIHTINLHPQSSVASFQTRIINTGAPNLTLETCPAACLLLDARLTRLKSFTGRWAREFQTEDIPDFKGTYLRENRNGRTSHDNFPGLIAATPHTHEKNGLAAGFHLGWSGNHRTRLDRLSDGRSFAQMGECFFPGEMILDTGETYDSPVLYAAISQNGFTGLSNKFHTHVRAAILGNRLGKTPRKIHYNTWEAVYFNHSEATLMDLAQKASEMGAERFVLDDGWFSSRRNDASGLGDWWVSDTVYPNGLSPLIEKVTALGMEFGLWVEPEMVNPDSDLYRAHPDWILAANTLPQIPFRGQYVLDLTQKNVTDYLFKALDTLLTENNIAYLKWDMNRHIHHPGSAGRPVTSAQTRALYGLIARLRSAHPNIEIESCASGGARADYGILAHTDRIWTSDSNDALDRQHIQRGASHFFPLEILGTHVGPETCHITGRKLSMEMRVATAFFGHMGMEVNLNKETEQNLATLKAGIALHKTHRPLLHSGAYIRLDTPAHINAFGVVAHDQSEAIFSWANMGGHAETLPGRIFFSGLDAARQYRVQIIWPSPPVSQTQPSIIDAAKLIKGDTLFSGAALMNMGLQAPLLFPETCLIYHLA